MKFMEYNPYPGRGCVVRTFTKLLGKDADTVQKELEDIAKEKGLSEINEIEVFDEYFNRNHYKKINLDLPVSELEVEKGKYGVFSFEEENYHLFAILDKIVYDKNQNYLNQHVISIYKLDK